MAQRSASKKNKFGTTDQRTVASGRPKLPGPVARPLFTVAILAIAVAAPAQVYEYRTHVNVLPNPAFDVGAAVERMLEETRDSSDTPELIARNRQLLLPQFQRERDGFEFDGGTTLELNGSRRYVRTVVPDQSTGGGAPRSYLFDGTDTVVAPVRSGNPGKVSAEETERELGSAVEASFLAGRPVETPSIPGGSSQEILYDPGERSQLWVVYRWTKAGRLAGARAFANTGSGKRLVADFAASAWMPDGRPKRTVVQRYVGSRKSRIEAYELVRLRKAKAYAVGDVLEKGTKVVDLRLGTDPARQASYAFNGRLPDLDELRKIAAIGSGEVESGGGTSAVNARLATIGGALLALGAVGLLLRRRNRRTA